VVQGVDAIEHTASPCFVDVADPQSTSSKYGLRTSSYSFDSSGYIKPAVQGTVGILESALKHAYVRIITTTAVKLMLHLHKDQTSNVLSLHLPVQPF